MHKLMKLLLEPDLTLTARFQAFRGFRSCSVKTYHATIIRLARPQTQLPLVQMFHK